MIKQLLSAAAAVCAVGGIASAQSGSADFPQEPRGNARTFYIGVGLGFGEVTEDGAVEEGFDFDGNPVVFNGALDYDTGFAGSLLVGYNLSDYFAVEAETTGRTNDFDGNIGDADFAVGTLMAGVVAKAPFGRAEPYVGAAAGLVSSNLEGGENAFGYQFKGGVRFALRGPHAVGVEASFLFSDGFTVDGDFGDLELDYDHAAYMLTYRYQGLGF